VIAVVFDHEPGWHIHTNDPKVPDSWEGFVAFPTEVTPSPVPGVKFGPVQWPKAHAIPLDLSGTGTPEPYEVFEGLAIAYIPFIIEPGASAGPTVSIAVSFQACDDRRCRIPENHTLSVTLGWLGEGETGAPPQEPSLFADFDRGVFAAMMAGTAGGGGGAAKGADDRIVFREFGLNMSLSAAGAGLALLLLLAAAGGLLLNLTPCVLPVIPLKIMGLGRHAGNPRRAMLMGVVMSVGVIAFWATIGLLMVSLTSFRAINQLFQQPLFTIGVGVFILVMGVGMLGLFTVRLPEFVYMVDPKGDTVPGSFLFGVMTAVLSTPCTAPFMGTAAAWATRQSAPVTMSVFAAIGLGMASPYLVLAIFPGLLSRVPRAGAGSDLVKQVMGLLMLAVAVFFLGTGLDPLMRLPIDPPVRWFWWVILGLAAAAMGWLCWRTFKLTVRSGTRVAVVIVAVLMTAATAIVVRRVTDHGPIAWQGYTTERAQAALASRQVVVIDFTAEWCLNCKTLENTVLHVPRVAAALNAPGVAALRADLTGKNPQAQAKLDELNWVGIPLLMIDGPGLKAPLTYDWYTPEMVLDAIKQAQGAPLAAGSPQPR
jgi:thiol:disulfide interchange protein